MEPLRALLDLSPSPMLVLGGGHVIAANDPACRALGYEPQALDGIALDAVITGWDRTFTIDETVRAASGDIAATRSDLHARRKDGSEIVFDANARVAGLDGELTVLTLHNVTGRRNAQASSHRLNARLGRRVVREAERLRVRTAELEARTRQLEARTRELEEANRQLQWLSYAVSHDLRAPLRAIGGFAQLLSQQHGGALDAEGRHFLDNIIQASAQMRRLIEDLLRYAALGRGAVTLQPVALSDLIAGVLRDYEPQIRAADAVIACSSDLPIVNGDHTLLMQTFSNLLDNALTYRRSEVRPTITIHAAQSPAEVVVSVADNGIGIEAQYLDRIFEIFQRLHRPEEYPGTGIGLALVRRAVSLQGGRVWAESTRGVGTTFHVALARP